MEIELKYSIPDAGIIDQMWHQEVFEEYGSVDRNSMIPMAATYYDTSRDGLFEREELNINLEEEQCRAPTLSIFPRVKTRGS